MFPIAISLPSIFACIVLKMILGLAWYSSYMFGNQWLRLVGKKQKDFSPNIKSFVLSFFTALVKVLATAILIYWIGAFTWQAGVIVGLIMGIGIVAADNAAAVIWEGKPMDLFLIDAGHTVLSFVITGAVLAIMAPV